MNNFKRQIFVEILANFSLELNHLDITKDSYISDVLKIVTKYFQADYCIWHRTKDYLDLKKYDFSDLQRIRVMKLDCLYGDETLMIVNPKGDYELECYLFERLKSILENISKCEILVSNLKSEIMTDTLTKVNNFESLQKRINSKRVFKNIGVCFADVNGLGIVNNLYGHEAGDKMLITVAQIMSKFIRKNDIYRKSGDEFIIICEDISENEFVKRIDNIENELNETEYSASFGVTYSDQTNNIEELIKLADELMYVKKEKFRSENPSKYLVRVKE